MSEATLDAHIRQLLESHRTPQVDGRVARRRADADEARLLPGGRRVGRAISLSPGQTVLHTFQTNGLLLDDDWCAFFKEHAFLVGLSVDGPRELSPTAYRSRSTPKKQGTFNLVMRGLTGSCRRPRRSTSNILCTVNAANEKHGRTVYRFFRDELGAKWMQFIPIVERATDETLGVANLGWSTRPGEKRLLYTQDGNVVTNRSVGREQYGRFLIDIFEDWVRHDVRGVRPALRRDTRGLFRAVIHLCIHAPTCGYGPAMESNGDVYSCDHFVEPR